MAKCKYYDPNEIDKVQAGYEKLDENEKLEARYRRNANIKKRTNDKEEKLEVEREIIKLYGSNIMKDEKYIKKHITTIYPFNCVKCDTYKIYPYQFLNAKDYISSKNCTSCIAFESARIKKYKDKNPIKVQDIIDCPCGKTCTATNLLKHNETAGHINGLEQLKIRGLRKSLDVKELRLLGSANNIKFYYKLKASVIIDALIKLRGEVIIPEEYK